MEAALAHPIFAGLRPLLDRLDAPLSTGLDELNALAEQAGARVKSGRPLRFVAPSGESTGYGEYELRIFRSGLVQTRPGNLHDLFNALAWLSFPETKAELNALHVREIPTEAGRRGRFRDFLTLLDEGGAIVSFADPELVEMMRAHHWKELFWTNRARALSGMRVDVLGHAVLEQSLRPWPGITCKVIVLPTGWNDRTEADARASAWLRAAPASATPRSLPSLPVFGYPGWWPDGDTAAFYDDARFFRPLEGRPQGKIVAGVGQAAAAAVRRAEESPGSAERDAG